MTRQISLFVIFLISILGSATLFAQAVPDDLRRSQSTQELYEKYLDQLKNDEISHSTSSAAQLILLHPLTKASNNIAKDHAKLSGELLFFLGGNAHGKLLQISPPFWNLLAILLVIIGFFFTRRKYGIYFQILFLIVSIGAFTHSVLLASKLKSLAIVLAPETSLLESFMETSKKISSLDVGQIVQIKKLMVIEGESWVYLGTAKDQVGWTQSHRLKELLP